MRIGRLEIKWIGYNKRYAKKMIEQIYSEAPIENSTPGYCPAYSSALIAAIKWHRHYTDQTTGECSLKESKELVEKILKVGK